MPCMRLAGCLLKGELHLGQPPFEFRTRLRLHRVLRLSGLPCIRQRALRDREPVLHFLRGGTQRRLLLAGPARGVPHRLLKLRDAPFDPRLFLQKLSPLLICRPRGLGKRLLARCDLPIRGRKLPADFFEFRREVFLRLLVPRLQLGQLLAMPGVLGGELGFELLAAEIHLGEHARRLRNLGNQRLTRAVQ